MILKLDMPLINPSLRGGKLKTWHKAEGESIGFGDDLCTVSIDDFAVLRRTGRATLLTGKKRKRLKDDLESRSGIMVNVVVTASDQGVMQRILRQAGDQVAIGDTLALVSTGESNGASLPTEWDDAPQMRVVGNVASGSEQY